jgi:hypothetical protein
LTEGQFTSSEVGVAVSRRESEADTRSPGRVARGTLPRRSGPTRSRPARRFFGSRPGRREDSSIRSHDGVIGLAVRTRSSRSGCDWSSLVVVAFLSSTCGRSPGTGPMSRLAAIGGGSSPAAVSGAIVTWGGTTPPSSSLSGGSGDGASESSVCAGDSGDSTIGPGPCRVSTGPGRSAMGSGTAGGVCRS